MKLESIIEDLEKFVKYVTQIVKDPKADARYEYAKVIINYLKDYKELKIKYENIERELLSRTNELIKRSKRNTMYE